MAKRQARRGPNHKPVFIDEPIQWHLDTSSYDRCPWCGLVNVGFLGARGRMCMNDACGVSPTLRISAKEFLRRKMKGECFAGQYTPGPSLPTVAGGLSLKQAQEASRDRQAKTADGPYTVVVWKLDHAYPMTQPKAPKKPEQAAAPGSGLWYELLFGRSWLPNQPYSALEQLANEGLDAPPQKFIRRAV